MTLKQENQSSKKRLSPFVRCPLRSLFSLRQQGCGGIEQIPLKRPSLEIGVIFAMIDRTRGPAFQVASVNISMI